MTGYEESVTDPSYVAQVLCFAYPLIGTYGVDEARMESDRVQCEGVVMRDARPEFAAWLREQRRRGAERCRHAHARAPHPRRRRRCAARSATPRSTSCTRGRSPSRRSTADRSTARSARPSPYSVGAGPRVVVVDLGSKRSIPRRLAEAGLEAYVVPGGCDADAILDAEPRAVLIANGPGDPAVLHRSRSRRSAPCSAGCRLFGVCLGHQLLGLALGHATFKLPFGHRGANHPVRDLETGRVLVTVQNHGFAVIADGDISHVSLNDGTCEGLAGDGFESVQFHPEASPGPLDALPFFDRLAETCRSAPTYARS